MDLEVAQTTEIVLQSELSTIEIVSVISEGAAISSLVSIPKEINSVLEEKTLQTVINVGPPGQKGPPGSGLKIDALGPSAEKTLYDVELAGFVFLDTTLRELFFRLSETPGVWSEGVPFGTAGVDGLSAYQVAVLEGFIGNEGAWLTSLIGPGGASAYQVALTNGFEGSQAAWLTSLVGVAGASAYQVALTNGFVGSQAAWLTSLVGAAGASAYQVAVAGGFIGTEAAWLLALKGAKGDRGDNLQIDAFGPPADKALYNSELEGFSFLDTDNNLLYFRPSITPGIWTAGISFGVGPVGPPGPAGATGVYEGPQIFVQATEPLTAVNNDIWIEIA